MKFALCNEMFEGSPLPQICSTARALGYHGLELAPFTLCDSAYSFSVAARKEAATIIRDHGLEVVGLHWLYAGQEGMHMCSPDPTQWTAARDYLSELVGLCAELGGKVMVIGSPQQRSLAAGQDPADAWGRACELFASSLDRAEACGVTLCIEPLSPAETDFINTVEEGLRMVRELKHPHFKIHLDVKAMASEARPIPEIIRSTPREDIGHFHVNDPNLYGPGMGELDYGPIAAAIHSVGWDQWLSVEVFKFDPDAETIARKSMDCLKQYL